MEVLIVGVTVEFILLPIIPVSGVVAKDNPLIAKVFGSYQYSVISNRQVMLCIQIFVNETIFKMHILIRFRTETWHVLVLTA